MSLVDETRQILGAAAELFAGRPAHAEIERMRARIDEPLRVAIAGKVKAGKSTLLNALVGERLAPTDTGECTKIVTWYRDGHTYQVMMQPTDGTPAVQLRFERAEGAIDIDLEGREAAAVDHLDVTWPSSNLRRLTLIDTPGVDSMTESAAARAFDFLDPAEADTPADAVLYLMKHIHASDLSLLEAFHDDSMATPSPVNAIAVLSRADEIGAGRPDSMQSAQRIAQRLGDDHRLRRLVQMIVPVAGLIAETGTTLTETEYRQLVELAGASDGLDTVLLSADRFITAHPETPLTSLEREALLDRFGLFGVRCAIDRIVADEAPTSQHLSDHLVELSGLSELRHVLSTLFLERSDVLKARSALLGIERLCSEHADVPGIERLVADLERVMSGAHPFDEMSTMAAIRSGYVAGSAAQLADLERLLGAQGMLATQRLGVAESTPRDELRQHAIEQLGRWQRLVENPLTTHDLARAMRTGIRTLEGMVAHAS